MNRRRWILGACGALTAGTYPAYFEPRNVELTSNRLTCGLSPGKPVHILHLTDFHASQFVSMNMIRHAIDLGLAQKPDLICVTGDFITFRSGFDEYHYVALLRRLSNAAPTFAVLGNHDGGQWAAEHGGFADHSVVEGILTKSGISLLHNRAEDVRLNGSDFSFVGVADLWSQEIAAEAAFQKTNPAKPTILLAHNPDSKDALKKYPWNVMLSGHTHGGQVIVPFKGACFAPVKDRRFIAGLKRWGSRQIFVNRGVGNLGGVRFECRPEVSILTLI
jgi:uncharacterized protein